MGRRALIYVQRGHLSARKQTAACLERIDKERWELSYLRPGSWREAVELIRTDQADVLLMAYGPRPGQQEQVEEHELIRQAVEAAGGEVMYCRPNKEPRPRLVEAGTLEMVRRMFEAGCDTDQIVQVLRKPRTRIQQILSRLRGSAVLTTPVALAVLDAYVNVIR